MNPLLYTINAHMNGGRCPDGKSLGECAAIGQLCDEGRAYEAYLYLWPAANDLKPAEVAQWFLDAGCVNPLVTAVLHDPENDVADAITPDGVRPWVVSFEIPDDKLQAFGFITQS